MSITPAQTLENARPANLAFSRGFREDRSGTYRGWSIPWYVSAVIALVCACNSESRPDRDEPLRVGDASRGQAAMLRLGCGTCHGIPGVPGARARIGPPLEGLLYRRYIAGRVPNTLENLVRFIRDPQSLDPDTLMPNLGVGAEQARDIVAYLYAEGHEDSAHSGRF